MSTEAKAFPYVAYTEQGDAVTVIADTAAGILVSEIYEDEEMGGEPYIIRGRLFDKPPVSKRHEEIEALDDLIATKKQELVDVANSLYREQLAYDERLKFFSKIPELNRLRDFIDGKITHYVDLCQWSGIKIIPFKDAISGEDSRGALKLLTLFGKSDGNLEWNLNYYSDGSGSKSHVIPCCGYEDALKVAECYIRENLPTTRNLRNLIDSAKKLGIDVPQGYLDKHYTQIANAMNNQIADYQSKIEGFIAEKETALSKVGSVPAQ